MKSIRLIFSFVVIAAATALFTGILGCEKDGDTGSGLDDYFAANPYISDPRDEGRNSTDGIGISPEGATATAIGQQIVFTVEGGDAPFRWGVAIGSAGSIAQQVNERQAVYTVSTLSSNNVIVSDVKGRAAIAYITSSSGSLNITPAGHIFTSAYTNGTPGHATPDDLAGLTIAFTATGGNPPYTWNSTVDALGNINASGLYMVANPVTAIGDNIVSVTDNSGAIATVTVTIQWKP